ncbi:putative bifunctional diguanylate cyclase/phosphodiesterase [Muricoccus radiodurans]|uniref:putative bifunctional diguanylate cyclase/phosphodiesterase n=1 Tax=Muricoccus radiodurans TaxID=2231721 RepID=UPI003CEBE154
MPPAQIPDKETERLAELRKLQDIDSAGEQLLDAFTRVARSLFNTPMAAISLMDSQRQYFKSILGAELRELPRDQSFCAYTILAPEKVLIVPDAAADPRFEDNPLVTGAPGIRFYAGAPVVSASGHAVGSICVIDHTPRDFPSEMEERLRDLARGVSAAFALRRATRDLTEMALMDPLTGVANRKALESLITPDSTSIGVLMLDLDRFKAINDTFGHAGGDQALLEVARRLKSVARASDTIVRFGGDEFAVILRDLRSPEGGLAMASRIHAALADTFLIDGTVVPLRTSVGFAGCPWHTSDPGALLPLADAALYEAKRAGRGTTRVAVNGVARPGRATLETRLREAFSSGAPLPFELALQPILRLPDGEPSSVEALLRWSPNTPDSPSPAEIIPLIEGLGQAVPLDRWVLGTVCQRLAGPSRPPCPVAVNISGSTFGTADFDAFVASVLDQHGLSPDQLIIEMTETSLSHDRAQTMQNIEGLKRRGVAVVLDDFGGGHSTLSRVRRYPFSKIKLDRLLVAGCNSDPRAATLLEAVSTMAAALAIPAVAEGVETEEDLAMVARLGVAEVQGYLLSRPVPWDDAAKAMDAARATIRRVLEPVATAV